MLCFPEINLFFNLNCFSTSQLFSCTFLSSNQLVFFRTQLLYLLSQPNFFHFFAFLRINFFWNPTVFSTFFSQLFAPQNHNIIYTPKIFVMYVCTYILNMTYYILILQAWTRKTYVKYPAGGASCWRTSSGTWPKTILAYTCNLTWNLVQGTKNFQNCFLNRWS